MSAPKKLYHLEVFFSKKSRPDINIEVDIGLTSRKTVAEQFQSLTPYQMLSLINEFGEYKFSINQIKEMKAVAISYDDFSAGELKEIIEPDLQLNPIQV